MFSVLISVYYKESVFNFCECIDSIFQQTKLPNEVILVEDGALGEDLNVVIKKYLSNYSVLKTISLKNNQGLGRALNEGLKHCSYDIVARMDTDDIAKPDRFEKQIAIFEKDPYIDVVSAWVDEFEGNTDDVKSIRKLPECQKEIFEYAKNRNPINHPAVMFRKKAVLAAGGYLDFPFFEDYYLWVRMLMAGATFYNIQESLLYFRFSPDMFKRRGGWKYAVGEFRFQNKIREIGFLSRSEFLRNISIRFITRILPNSLRAMLYKKILRK